MPKGDEKLVREIGRIKSSRVREIGWDSAVVLVIPALPSRVVDRSRKCQLNSFL